MRHYQAEGASARVALVLAHGAGAGQDHPFMVAYARGIASRGIDVVTFNFPYIDANRKVPDRAPILEDSFRQVIAESRARFGLRQHALVVGGKSMGGRMATHLAAQRLSGLCGVVGLGYPLHPPGKPEQLRVQHLPLIAIPVLIVQGERDAFGTPAELRPYVDAIPGGAILHVVAGGDHSLAVRGIKPEQTRDQVVDVIRDWIATLGSGGPTMRLEPRPDGGSPV